MPSAAAASAELEKTEKYKKRIVSAASNLVQHANSSASFHTPLNTPTKSTNANRKRAINTLTAADYPLKPKKIRTNIIEGAAPVAVSPRGYPRRVAQPMVGTADDQEDQEIQENKCTYLTSDYDDDSVDNDNDKWKSVFVAAISSSSSYRTAVPAAMPASSRVAASTTSRAAVRDDGRINLETTSQLLQPSLTCFKRFFKCYFSWK